MNNLNDLDEDLDIFFGTKEVAEVAQKPMTNSEKYIAQRNAAMVKKVETLTPEQIEVIKEERENISPNTGKYPATPEESFQAPAAIRPNTEFDKEPDYKSMPLGMKEAQERNGVRDHGLKTGNFVRDNENGVVRFEETEKGAFAMHNPNDVKPVVADYLNRKHPGVPYVGNGDEILYIGGIDPAINKEEVSKFTVSKIVDNDKPVVVYEGRTDKSFHDDIMSMSEYYGTSIEKEVIPELKPLEFDIEGEDDLPQMGLFETEVEPEPVKEKVKRKKAEPVQFSLLPENNLDVEESTNPKVFVGIDPGKAGGIVAMTDAKIVGKWPMPLIGKDVDAVGLWTILDEIKQNYNPTLILEEVHSLHKMSASTNFSMGHTLGLILGIVIASKIRLIRVQPKAWQKEIWLNSEIEYLPIKPDQVKPSVNTKLTSIKAALRLFPNADFRKSARATNPHDGICDACCMAEYGRRNNL